MGLEPYGKGVECEGKPIKPPSNVTEIVSRFAKVCKLRSIGVFASENVKENHPQNLYLNNGHVASSFGEETSSSDATEEADFDAENVHPHQVEVPEKEIECGDLEILKLFDTVKALKLAYVQLQEAHIPYDPDKIRAADELLVSHLEALCKIKRIYKERQLKDVKSVSARSALLLAEIQVQERMLEKLKSHVEVKKSEMVKLQHELQDLELKNKKLAEEFLLQERESFKVLNIPTFEEIVKGVAKAIHDFAKPLIALMKVSGWDLDHAANVIEDSVLYAKRSHKKYAFEAYIARRMFHGFAVKSYDVRPVMKVDDPIDALIENPQSSFAKYCRAKYLMIVHPAMEVSFFGNEDHRTLVINGVHPHTQFYRAFVKMAKWVWILQGIASSVEPKADIFRVSRGTEFSDVYMECIEELNEGKTLRGEEQRKFKVEFMVLPGFIVEQRLIKSRVYISEMKS